MKHSNQVREFSISDKGLKLEYVYLGSDGILTGSARQAHLLQKHTESILQKHALGRKDKQLERKAKELESKIAGLNWEFESIKEELMNDSIEQALRKEVLEKDREKIGRLRNNRSEKS